MPLSIEPYNPLWKAIFDQLQQVYVTSLKDFDMRVEHVGSTAVPGLWAKPILDIDIIIEDTARLHAISGRLEALGYVNRGEQGIPGRFAFRQSSPFTPLSATRHTWMEHHLYVCYASSIALKNHLVFRDALLQDPALVKQYSRLKQALVETAQMTRENYTRRKTDFILTVLTSCGLGQAAIKRIQDVNL